MPKKSDRPLKAATIKLYVGDVETLDLFYPEAGGFGPVIRALVSNHCRKLLETESRKGTANARVQLTDEQLEALIGDATSVDAAA